MLTVAALLPGIGATTATGAAAQQQSSNRVIDATTEPETSHWLVTVDGQRIACAAPWQVRGRQVVYENLSGTLVSVPLSEIDLAASELATNPPPPEPPAAPEPVTPVLVLRSNEQPELAADRAPPLEVAAAGAVAPEAPSEEGESASESALEGDGNGDADSQPVDDDGSRAEPDDRSPTPNETRRPRPQTGPSSTVTVTSWQDLSEEFDSATIYGTLENTGGVTARRITVTVVAVDEAGNEVARQRASTLSTTLDPGETTNFRALFTEIGAHSDIQFEIEASR